MRRRGFLECRDSAGGAGRVWASVTSSVPSQPSAIETPNRMISTSTPRVAMRNHQNSRSIVGWFSSLNDSSQAANQRCASSSDTSEPIESAKTVPRTAKTRFDFGRRMYTLDPFEPIRAATARAAVWAIPATQPWCRRAKTACSSSATASRPASSRRCSSGPCASAAASAARRGSGRAAWSSRRSPGGGTDCRARSGAWPR